VLRGSYEHWARRLGRCDTGKKKPGELRINLNRTHLQGHRAQVRVVVSWSLFSRAKVRSKRGERIGNKVDKLMPTTSGSVRK
jgi:hypothetical protein